MEIECLNVGNSVELSTISIPIKENSFIKLVETVKSCYEAIGIVPENMNLEYQRYANANSVLAIKLSEGDDRDKNNYVFIGTSTHYYSGKPSCDVFMHADANCAQSAIEMARLISRKIVGFFEETEQELFDKRMTDAEFAVSIPLKAKKQELPESKSKNQKIFTKIAELFKREQK